MGKFKETTGNELSRRQFVLAAGLGAAMLAANPESAFAAVAGEDAAEKTADELWAEAVAKAEKNGDPIYYNQIPHTNPIPQGKKVTGTASETTTVMGIYDRFYAVAVFDVNASNRIWKFYDGWVYAGSSSVVNQYYNYTIADGGRSLVMNYVVTMRNYLGFNQGFSMYASFGPSGSGYLRISYLS